MQQLKFAVLNYQNGFPSSSNMQLYHSCSHPVLICAAVLSKVRSFFVGLTQLVDQIWLIPVRSFCRAFVPSVLISRYPTGIYPWSSSAEINGDIVKILRSLTKFLNSQKFCQMAAQKSCLSARNLKDSFFITQLDHKHSKMLAF